MTAQPATRAMPAAAAERVALPSAWRTGLARSALEIRIFFREKEALAFIFALPAVLLVLLGSIFGSQVATRGVTVGELFAAGLIGGGIVATSFQYLGIGIATERDRGLLKRLYGTPMPRTAYFVGKIIQVLAVTAAEVAVLIAVGMVFYHLRLPSSPERWWTFGWVFILGTTASSLLGIAASSLARSARSATPVITMPFVVLQFISGVYVPFVSVPPWLQHVAAFFPLKWICQGLRSVFLPAQAVVLEPAHSFELARVALVLGAWIAAGLVLCLTTFRWQRRGER